MLRCVHAYAAGPLRYRVGEIITGSAEFEDLLLRDSPGSFVRVEAPASPAPADAAQAMSTETATGLTVPDRRLKGALARVRRS